MKVRKVSLTNQILIVNIVVLLITTIILGMTSVSQSKKSISKLLHDRILDIARSGAAIVDGDVLQTLTAEDKDTEAYQSELNKLAIFRDNTEIEYIYAIKAVDDKNFVFTIDTALEDPAEFGQEIEYTEDDTDQDTDPELFPQDLEHILQVHLIHGQTTDDQGRRLGTGISARSHQKRQIADQDDHL